MYIIPSSFNTKPSPNLRSKKTRMGLELIDDGDDFAIWKTLDGSRLRSRDYILLQCRKTSVKMVVEHRWDRWLLYYAGS